MTETPTTAARQKPAWEDIVILIIGAWLTFCPPTLELSSSLLDTSTTVIAGLAFIIFGGTAMRTSLEWPEWASIVSGVALVVAPWALGFALKTAVINAVASCVAAIVLAAWRVYEIRSKRAAAAARSPLPGEAAGTK